MKKLLTISALSLAASVLANAETLIQLQLPETKTAGKSSLFYGNQNAENILNKAAPWGYNIYVGNNGGSSSWAGEEGKWTQDVGGTSGSVTLAGRGGTQGESVALVLGSEIVDGTKFNSVTFEIEIPESTLLSGKSFNVGVGYWSSGSSSFVKTATESVPVAATGTTTSTVTLTLDSLATWSSGDKIIVGVGGPGFTPATNTYQVNVKGVSIIPEPSAFGLLAGVGALALVASRRRRK